MVNLNDISNLFTTISAKVCMLDFQYMKNLLLEAINTYVTWWLKLYHEAPHHIFVETGLVLFILWLGFIRRTVDPENRSKKKGLTEREIDWLIDTWEPEPLVPVPTARKLKVSNCGWIIDSVDGLYVKLRGIRSPVLNLSSFDLLGLGQLPELKEASRKALEFYGCGSCGPRGFYGTIDLHLKFESAIAVFMKTAEAISYSDSASAVSSTIPAFAKRGDLILVDEACCEAIQTGLMLSRATIQTFQHNDMNHLRTMLESIAADDIRLKRDSLQQRRFIVVEGLYRNIGDLCPLPELVALKEKFCYRLMMDESLSFGAIGKTGRGVTEHFDIDIMNIEIINIAMDTTLASVGGLCIGSREVVDHQRLSGAGYCYSAAAPPFMSAAGLVSLAELEKDPSRLSKLHENTRLLAEGLSRIPALCLASGDDVKASTPIIHLRLRHGLTSWEEEEDFMRELANCCAEHGVGIVPTIYPNVTSPWSLISNPQRNDTVMPASLRPSVRLCVSAMLSTNQISDIIHVISTSSSSLL
eukprot:gene10070-20987_t